jgi:nucleotide-binding universal stress UspA family protein
MFRTILVGLDGSAAAQHALVRALDLAALCGAELHILSVEERLPAYAATVGEVQVEEQFEHGYFRRIQHEARRLAGERGVPVHLEIVPGHAAQVIARLAVDHQIDLIVVGHTGHSRLHHLFLGSTADRVVEGASCPVLVVR